MRLKSWSERKAAEPTLYVRVRDEDGEVVVYLADGHGNRVDNGNLLVLSPGEPGMRSPRLSPKYGFPLNKRGQLRIKDLPEEPLEEPTE